MKSDNLKTKIFLDGGDPEETKQILDSLGFLDGQTTNPTLIAKNPNAQERLAKGDKFNKDEIYNFYKDVVTKLSQMIPEGSVSIEVYADKTTTADEMFNQGKEMFGWIPNAHIKYPTTAAGLEAAERSIKEGMRVNMTLVFTQEQAAAIYAATKGASKGQVFVSPFVGRLDDKGINGMDLITNILRMYEAGDGHVEVLTASVRTLDHFKEALKIKSDIITTPFKVLTEWVSEGKLEVDESFAYNSSKMNPIEYIEINLDQNWRDFDIKHELTDAGIDRFASDWNSLIS